jgi:hypothetical protein
MDWAPKSKWQSNELLPGGLSGDLGRSAGFGERRQDEAFADQGEACLGEFGLALKNGRS